MRRGWTTECLKAVGKTPDSSDMLTILVIVGSRTGRDFLSSQVGTGSRLDCLLGQTEMRLRISSSEAGVKVEKVCGTVFGRGTCGS